MSDTVVFLILAFGISIAAGLGAFAIGREQTFEDPRALPLLLITIWSPNVAAVAVTLIRGESLRELVAPLSWGAPAWVWLGALLPLAVAGVVARRRAAVSTSTAVSIRPVALVGLVGMNLMMGPVGEEIGWRGWWLPELADDGLLWAGLVIGIVWALWHLPLWWLPSPHREIPFAVFFATVVCFSMLMTALWHGGNGALGPIVLFHLCANVGVGWLEFSERSNAATAYRTALPVYGVGATVAAGWLWTTTG